MSDKSAKNRYISETTIARLLEAHNKIYAVSSVSRKERGAIRKRQT